MNLLDSIKRPSISEKTTIIRDSFGKYSFEVDMRATKKDIASAVSKLFDVEVTSVRTMICPGKAKRRRNGLVPAQRSKKAIVTLAKDQKIALLEEV